MNESTSSYSFFHDNFTRAIVVLFSRVVSVVVVVISVKRQLYPFVSYSSGRVDFQNSYTLQRTTLSGNLF